MRSERIGSAASEIAIVGRATAPGASNSPECFSQTFVSRSELREGQRPDQHEIRQGEDGNVGADADRDQQNRGRR